MTSSVSHAVRTDSLRTNENESTFSVSIDEGIRCPPAPCPTYGEEWGYESITTKGKREMKRSYNIGDRVWWEWKEVNGTPLKATISRIIDPSRTLYEVTTHDGSTRSATLKDLTSYKTGAFTKDSQKGKRKGAGK